MDSSKRKVIGRVWTTVITAVLLCGSTQAKPLPISNGFIEMNGRILFPIGFYELPKTDDLLKEMAEAGVNLMRCHSRTDLDRVQAVGMMGWVPVNLATEDLKQLQTTVESLKNHPALAVWEGPDEIVHTFTAASGLFRTKKIYKTADAWPRQSPEAVAYSEEQASKIIPRLRRGIELIRKRDQRNRPIWINEAAKSDLKFVRQYLDYIDITGCDLYPVHEDRRDIATIGDITDRWNKIGRYQKPVWMVLQAFAWSELGDYFGEKVAAYPSFSESRFMAYDAIVHGAKGILYWGSHYLQSEPFRQSIYALTSELSNLQPFLVAPENPSAKVSLVQMRAKPEDRGVKISVRQSAEDWLIIIVNEDDRFYLGVEVTGLDELDGHTLKLLYGQETAFVQHGELLTRINPLEVKIFSTNKSWETTHKQGRDFER